MGMLALLFYHAGLMKACKSFILKKLRDGRVPIT